MIKTALISVSDKTGIVEFAKIILETHGVKILSTGGTAALMKEAGIAVIDVSEYTEFPEMMDGRVKTLHPRVHGGILARRDHADDKEKMQEHGIQSIDLVVVNLYPFEKTVQNGAAYEECIENIDIGGPAMVRSAAKNHNDVTIITDVVDCLQVLDEMNELGGATSLTLRRRLAAKAFAHTAYYDALVSRWFANEVSEAFPQELAVPMRRSEVLRYGENPHQSAAFYTGHATQGTLAAAQQIHGKALSFNNINDTDAAWKLVSEFTQPAVAIIKHANPCGVAMADTVETAYHKAFACDPQSAYGGIIAVNRTVDAGLANAISGQFAEVVIAPSYDDDALEVLKRKKNLRILHTSGALLPKDAAMDVRTVSGGYLLQSSDDVLLDGELTYVSKRQPDGGEQRDMEIAFAIAKHVKSNAIVLVKDGASIGIGAGQMSRVDSVRVACQKAAAAGLETTGAVLASDAFFPFDDNVHHAAEAGIAAIIQPGGSIRDDEVIAAADSHDMLLCFTGIRHFRH